MPAKKKTLKQKFAPSRERARIRKRTRRLEHYSSVLRPNRGLTGWVLVKYVPPPILRGEFGG